MSIMELSRPGNDINNAEAPTECEKGGSIRRWMVVAGSMTSIWATYGLLASNGVLLSYWTSNQLADLPHSSTAWINGVHLFLTLFLGSPVGIIFDKHGSHILMITGSVIYLAGIFGMAEGSQFWHFMVTYGILGGTGCSILSTVAISVLGHWFDQGKGLATGIVMLGGSLGGVMFPLVLRPLFERIGWPWSIRALGLFITVLVALGLLGVRSQKSIKRTQAVPLKSFLQLTCVLVVVGIGAFDFVLFGALGLLPTFSKSLGNSEETGYNLLATLNAASAAGRVMAGMLGDQIGPFNAILSVLAVGLISIIAFWLQSSHSVALLYLFAAIFGLSSGGALSLEPLCIGQLCPVPQFGQYYGTCYLVVAALTLVCIPIGSSLLESLGQQGFVLFFGGILLIAVMAFAGGRWALMNYTWRWNKKM